MFRKNIVFYITSIIVLILVCVSLYFLELILYSYVTLVLLVLLIISLFVYLIFTNSKLSKFKRKVKKIIKEHENVLVKTEEVLEFTGKEIKELETFEELLSRQAECQHSVNYISEKLSTIFLLITDNTVYYFILKEKYDVLNLVEEELKKVLYNNENADLDGDILKDLEKTTIINLPNVGTYKISPVRDKKNEKKEKTVESENTKVNDTKEEIKEDLNQTVEEVVEEQKNEDLNQTVEEIPDENNKDDEVKKEINSNDEAIATIDKIINELKEFEEVTDVPEIIEVIEELNSNENNEII